MKLFLLAFMTVAFITGACVSTVYSQTTLSYNDVLLIVNDSSRNSIEIGNFFAQRRHIPAKNIFHIQIDTSKVYYPDYGKDGGETIDSATFMQKVWFNLENYMQANNLADSINYIVTTKGCPLRVTTSNDGDTYDTNTKISTFSGLASFNDCLALINCMDSTWVLTRKDSNFVYSPYYISQTNYISQNLPPEHFKHDKNTMPMYLTTRLDAYTVAEVESYIMKAETTAVIGQGIYLLDENPSVGGDYLSGNQWMAEAAQELAPLGFDVYLDTTVVYVTHRDSVIGYTSWGSNDGNSVNYTTHAIPHNQYLNGAIGETYVSTGGRSFNPGTGYGQSLIADWIAEGISGIKGYTDEPYLDVMAEPNILFPLYASGFNMAESYWSASPLAAWRQVVIGDPKMSLRPAFNAPVLSIDFKTRQRYVSADTQLVIYNTSGLSIPVYQPVLTGNAAGQLVATIAGVTSFPHTLLPGDSLVMNVAYLPVVFPAFSATYSIPYRLPFNPDTLQLQASFSGNAGLLKFAKISTSVNINSTAVGDSSIGYFTIQNNTLKDTIILTSYRVIDTSNFSVSQLQQGDRVLIYAGSTDTIPIMFTPHNIGEFVTTLSNITVNAPVSEYFKFLGSGGKITIDGLATPDVSSFAKLSTDGINFGSVSVGTTKTDTLVVKNIGSNLDTFVSIKLRGIFDSTFAILNSGVVTVNVGDSIEIPIQFTPHSIGDKNDFVQIATVDGDTLHANVFGAGTSSSSVNTLPITQSNFTLNQNYPNPFSQTTLIDYYIFKRSFVHLAIYDELGREVATLASSIKDAGSYSAFFSASTLPEGVYFCKLTAGTFADTKMMQVIK